MFQRCHPSSSNDISSNASLSKFLSNVVFRLKGSKCTGKCFVVMGGDLSDRSDDGEWLIDSQGRYKMRIHCTYCPTISVIIEFTTTKRGARSLLHDGYQYTINRRTADGQTYWRCFDRTCGGRAVTDINDCLVSANNNHNHPPDVVEVAVAMFFGIVLCNLHQNF